MKSLTTLVIVLALGFPAALSAQVIESFSAPLDDPFGSAVEAPPGAATASPATASPVPSSTAPKTADATAAKRTAEAAQRKQKRMQTIQRLQFDRRPSAILQAWAKSHGLDTKTKPSNETNQPYENTEEPPTPMPGAQAAPGAAKTDWFDEGAKWFQQQVTLGEWHDVRHFLMELPLDEGRALYLKVLQSLQSAQNARGNVPPEMQAQMAQMQAMQMQQQGRFPENNSFQFEDVIALAGIAPVELDANMIRSLAAILRETINQGNVIDKLIQRLKEEVARPKDLAALTTRQVAQLLVAAGQPIEAGKFLPSIEQASQDKDFEGLNLLSQHLLALHADKKKVEDLERAWEVTQAVLAADANKEAQNEALQRAVDLAPRIKEELGQTWLVDSFKSRPQRGMQILASIGSTAARGLQERGMDSAFRLKSLQLQTTAVEALLKTAPDQAKEWQKTLDLLAANWLHEATASYQFDQSTSRGPSLQRDPFGNYFYYEDNPYMQQQRMMRGLQAIKTGELLEIKPSNQWLSLVSASLQPKFDMVFAQLYLKVEEEDNAFPCIERLAAVYPDLAKGLVDEFLRVWTKNHDPNANRNRTNYYMFNYGYSRRAESIPLTRSKQERNLRDLAELVKRLKALPLKELNEQLLAQAFTTCHSSAEVYRLEAIETVFGSLDAVGPKTLAELTQQMRANLIGVWRQPAQQEEKQTKRKQKDIQAEVLRGYSVAHKVIDRGLEKNPNHWGLVLAKAALDHDENNYRAELAGDSKFSENRDQAFAGFERAAQLYAAEVGKLEEAEQTARVYEMWYYASLGACDLEHVSQEKVPDLRQPQRVRDAIRALPGEAAERHLAMFANSLFTRMSAVNPAVKFRYVRTGLEIVGDHKQAHEARKVHDYYNDLVTEIALESKIDGSDVVGHTEPFGVFINLRHTRDIERESGGFSKYLQNQNTGSYYNYGRPLENYRDKFEEIVKQSLAEHFEILSVTFQSENVNSKATGDYGWRVTPYAYLLLKARGPEVDKIPPVRLDLDFLDTSGYVIIPIESPAVPIDASRAGDERPVQNLKITQTLDERQADQGKLILEIKATGQGLVPKLDSIVELAPPGFNIIATDDQGTSVSRFDPDSEQTVMNSERTWMVTMQAKPDLPERPTSFQFGEPKRELAENIYQRYRDADLQSVENKISLVEQYGKPSRAWLAPLIGAIVTGIIALSLLVWWLRRVPQVAETQMGLPESITPFTVLGLLRQIERANGFDVTNRRELATCIDRLEEHYFFRGNGDEPNLREIARNWVEKSRNTSSGNTNWTAPL